MKLWTRVAQLSPWYLPAGIAAAGVGVLALASRRPGIGALVGRFGKTWRDVRGFPQPPNAEVVIGTEGSTLGYVTLKPRFDVATPQGLIGQLAGQEGRQAALYVASAAIEEEFARRRKLLPADADPSKPDKYSRDLFVYASTNRSVNTRYYPGHAAETAKWFYSSSVPCAIDEFGRIASCATSSSQIVPLIGKILDVVLPVVAVAVPGYGTAIYSGYLMVKSVAAGGDWKDLALAAARSQIPPGVEQAAFDFGVAVVLKKESIGEAGEEALLGQMSPAEREAYAHGKAAAEAGLSGKYGKAAEESLRAYYTPR